MPTLPARRPRSTLKILALMLLAAAGSAPRAEANAIIDLTVNYNTPIVGPQDAFFSYDIFTSPSNTWATATMWAGSAVLTSGGSKILPGSTTFEADIPVADLSNVYFAGSGDYLSSPPSIYPNIFVAEPPTGIVSDALAFEFGPPWTSLATLTPTDPLYGTLWVIAGVSNQSGGSWAVGTWEARQVPEPSSIVLFAIGLCALASVCRFRNTATRWM